MDERRHIRVITISQQYGSDGHKIAAKLAERFQWLLTDHEIGRQVAQSLDMMEEEAAFYDEHTFSFIERILLSFRYLTPRMLEAWSSQYTMPPFSVRQERVYREILRQVIEASACSGNRVIVGHGAQVILADRPDVFHIRIVAPMAQRLNYAVQNEHIGRKDAQNHIRYRDRNLERHLQSQYHRHIDDPLLYDLVIDNAILDVESQVDRICLAIEPGRSLSF